MIFHFVLSSPAIVNLSFFRNLTRIGPSNDDEYQWGLTHRYAVYIVENPNLKVLWSRPVDANRTLIVNGSIALQGNALLCYGEIQRWQLEALQQNVTGGDLIDFESNGYEATCQYEDLHTTAVVRSYRHATIMWEHFPMPAGHKLLGYYVYYIEASKKNVTYSEGLDSCVT